LEEAARRCGSSIEVHGSGAQVRIDCPFGCAGDHAGKHEVSVNVGHASKPWRCHSYECGARGDIIHLIHGLLTGARPPEKIAGRDFLAAKKVVLGDTADRQVPPTALTHPRAEAPAPPRNVPLAENDNEKVRELVGLESKLVTDAEAMSPAASRWWRMRPYLTPEICTRWGVGVMPLDGGGDKRGWSLRGKIVYRFLAEDGQVLSYVGRDPDYEQKLAAFEALRPEVRDPAKAPAKYHFPKSFSRGLELYGQHSSRLDERPEYREFLARHGLILVEGFNDVLALDHLGVYAEAICSNQIADQHLAKIIERANRLASGRVSLLFDCNDAGDAGAKEAAWKLLQASVDVRLGWSQDTHGRQFRGKEPECLTRSLIDDSILPRMRR
ncbi:MAG: hypothetical protein KY475_06760, partial [Planctomycetes bacterium]|nr:hypothetical protein [Planctomycetota bacterium]